MDDKIKRVMLILVFLIILMSVIGTLTFIESFNNMLKPSEAQQTQDKLS